MSHKSTGACWVKLKRYCQLFNETPEAIYARRYKGLWLDGLQCKRGEDGRLWVNIEEVIQWQKYGKAANLAYARGA